MLKVSPNVKFSYNLVKGSISQRKVFVSSLNEKLFEQLQPIVTKDMPIRKFKSIYNKTLPEKKKIEIKTLKESKDFEGASDYLYDSRDYINGMTLEIPAQRSKILKDALVTVMHENTHILDTLSNPKHTVLTQKLYREGKYDNKRDNWFLKVLYNEERPNSDKEAVLDDVKEKTRNFLKGKSNSDKILLLQDARYQLEQEQHAYFEQLKYAKKIKDMGEEVSENDLTDCEPLYMFTEKIQLLKEMAFDLISQERKKISKKYK